jgi:hypothetical protein
MGSKKGGDYCWSIFSGEAYRPLGAGREEPVDSRGDAQAQGPESRNKSPGRKPGA